MSLVAGTRFGPYEILHALGAGGMGEVYRARDTTLARDVAIKILPPAFARDPERLQRFEREARLLASLNHPHIGAIYGLEHVEGVRALVLELVEGETLADRLQRGAVPVREALTIAQQICDALDAAHERGIVHRDLKPANIKITPDGVVKVLDFGLAKARDASASDLTHSPTTIGPTGEGMLLGTAPYMSPEQARGKVVDKRTDVWAFGCVLYETLTGQRPFRGETSSDVIAAILERQVDWTALPDATPASVRRLLARCLDKDPKRRLRDMADARRDVDDALAEPEQSASVMPSSSRPTRRMSLMVVSLLILAAFASGMGLQLLRDARPASKPLTRFAIEMPTGANVGDVAISPDGTRLIYDVTFPKDPPRRQLYLRALGQLDGLPIPGTEWAVLPFFSPDGLSVGFFQAPGVRGVRQWGLKKMTLGGGSPMTLGSVEWNGGSWSADNTILFTPSLDAGVSRIPAAGGSQQILSVPDRQKGELWHHDPQSLPDSDAILFTIRSAAGVQDDRIAVQSLRTGERRVLIERGRSARYVPTGHILYVRDQSLMAVPFDLRRLSVTGPAVTVVDGLSRSGSGSFTFSATGTLAYIPASAKEATRQLSLVDRHGAARPLTEGRAFESPRISPDGRRVAVTIAGPVNQDIWIYDISRETLTRLTSDGTSHDPIWTTDGTSVTYVSRKWARARKDNRKALFSKLVDGGTETTLFESEDIGRPSSWSPDGRWLLFEQSHGAQNRIWLLDAEHRARLFLQTRFSEGTPAFSPDGRWVAYASNESGNEEVYVQPFSGPGKKLQVSSRGGSDPIWARTGHELFFRNNDSVMVAAVTLQPDFTAAKPTLWFDAQLHVGDVGRSYDVTPDGQRLVSIKSVQEAYPTKVNVVENWFEELKQKVKSQ